MLLVGAVLSGVEGLRLKTVAKEPEERLFRTTAKEPEELLDFDQTPDNANLDFYEEKMGAAWPACDAATLAAVTAENWKALSYDGKKTPSNYCHAHPNGGAKWFCWSNAAGDVCMDTNEASTCTDLQSATPSLPDTADGWAWDDLPYDQNFGCAQRENSAYAGAYEANSCKGPTPSDSCTSNTAYCWEGKCIDVMENPDTCDYAPHGTTKGKDTDDGWDWSVLNYDIRAGCFTQEVPPMVEAFTPSDLIDDTKGSGEPFRQLFMQRYLIWCEFADWKNNKQRRIADGRTYGRATNLGCKVGRAKFDTNR